MATYKVVDADKLDSDLKAVADRIRAKSGASDKLDFPDGFKNAVDSIATGGGGLDTSDATAQSGDVLTGKTFYARGTKLEGSIPSRSEADVSISDGQVIVSDGHYQSAVTKSVPKAGEPTIDITFEDITAEVRVDVTEGEGYVSGGSYSKTHAIPSIWGREITPGIADQYVSGFIYLLGDITVKGDANLLPENIVKGKSIFGVEGTHETENVVTGAPNGTAWTATNITSNAKSLQYVHDKWFSRVNGTLYYSKDGIAWISTGFTTTIGPIAYCKGAYFATASNGVYRSADGISWSSVYSATLSNYYSITIKEGGGYLAFRIGNTLYLSADGTTWNTSVDPNASGGTGTSLVYFDSAWCTPYSYYSLKAQGWYALGSLTYADNQYSTPIVYKDVLIIILSDTSILYVRYLDNNINFGYATFTDCTFSEPIILNDRLYIASNNSMMMESTFVYTDDGIAFSQTNSMADMFGVNLKGYTNGMYIADGWEGTYVSKDGINFTCYCPEVGGAYWGDSTMPISWAANGMLFTKPQQGSGTMGLYYSTDGSTWTWLNYQPSYMAFGNGTHVMVNSGAILYSMGR